MALAASFKLLQTVAEAIAMFATRVGAGRAIGRLPKAAGEKLARMQMPYEPASIMKSMQLPLSSKMVGATGNAPR